MSGISSIFLLILGLRLGLGPGMGAGQCPIRFAANTWHASHPGLNINFEVSPTHYSFTVNSRHCLHLPRWMLKAHQPLLAVKHAPYNAIIVSHPPKQFIIKSLFE